MALFEYQTLWIGYIVALAIMGISGYFLIKPIPWGWLRWNLLVAIMVFFAAPIQMSNDWMVPSALYFLFEYFFIQNEQAISVLVQLGQHVMIALIVTSLMLYGIHLSGASLRKFRKTNGKPNRSKKIKQAKTSKA